MNINNILSWLMTFGVAIFQIEGYRILAIIPVPGRSHFTFAEQLFKGLAKRGHQVDVIGHFPLKTPHPNYRDFSIQGSLPSVVNNLSYSDFTGFASFNIKKFLKSAGDDICELLGHPILQDFIKNKRQDPPYDVYITELFVSNCYLALGHHFKLPMIGLVTSSWFDWLSEPLGNPHNTAVISSSFSPRFHPMTFWERLQNTLSYPMITFTIHYYMEKQLKYIHDYIGKDFSSVYGLHKDLSLVLVNSHHSLNEVRPLVPNVVEVGGLHIRDENQTLPKVKALTQDLEYLKLCSGNGVQEWLDGSENGFVYVSFGSMVKIESFPNRTLDVFYETFRNLRNLRFLMKIAKKEELPLGLPENVMTHHWLPQLKVLGHKNIKAFVTHGGSMGTLESIKYGVPMVGFSLFGDQHVNLRNYARKKIAVNLDHNHVTTEEFTFAIKTVTGNPAFRSSIQDVSKLYFDRPMHPLDTAIFWVEYVIRNKNVLQSPSMHMPWWKSALLDVYAAIIFTLLATILILKFVFKKIFKICCPKTRKCNEKKKKTH